MTRLTWQGALILVRPVNGVNHLAHDLRSSIFQSAPCIGINLKDSTGLLRARTRALMFDLPEQL